MQLQSLPLLQQLLLLLLLLATPAHSRVRSNLYQSQHQVRDQDAAEDPLVAASLLLEELQQTSGQLVNLTRHHDGDTFHTSGLGNSACNADTCIGLSSGTASLVRLPGEAIGQGNGNSHPSTDGREPASTSLDGGQSQMELLSRRFKLQKKGRQPADEEQQSGCTCRCLPYLRAYREDLGICVDDIHECSLSPFVSGSSSEKIPFVFLPLKGQIIYPSREISFASIQTPVCAVTGAQYLGSNGWSDLRNPIDTDYPFRMFRDEGRSFLLWLGEADLRQKMQGRLIVVHLVCRDMTVALNATKVNPGEREPLMPPRNVHSPCVAFRVNGSPVKYTHNVPEVFFQPANSTTLASTSDGMTMREYVVIGICSLLLGLIYVASVFLYLYMKKRKRHSSRNSLDNLANDINYPKNDQVTYGAPFSRVGSIYSANSMGLGGTGNDPNHRTSIGSHKEDMGIVKNNPLLQHFPQLSEREHNSGFASDISNSNSECEMEEKIKTSVLVHPQLSKSPKPTDSSSLDTDDFLQDNECLPAENVAVIDELMSEEKLENLRAMVSGNVRKKLYFNPAYFEPHLLAEPPQAAIEFLQKIREVIAIAKYKMAAKRYQPSLNIIPEELQHDSPSSSSPTMFNIPLQQSLAATKGMGDKRNSIEQWLQSVPNSEASAASAQKTPSTPAKKGSGSPSKGSLRREITAPKERPPPPPLSKVKTEEASSPASPKAVTPSRSPVKSNPDSPKSKSPGSNSFESFSAFSVAANVYGFAETGGEIYNNPKFMLADSPAASLRSASSRSKSLRKRSEVLDQFAAANSTPTSLTSFDRQHYNMLRSMKPAEVIYDSLKREFAAHIPTPDYDSTIEKKIKDIYSSTQSSIPSVPTPDYSSLSRKSLKQFQPDSPIYRRKSPQYLIVDYETDSLERLEPSKRKSSHSSSSPSSDVSSQLSPSLSTALPLEEEMEISHTVYDRLDGFRKEGEMKMKRLAGKHHHQHPHPVQQQRQQKEAAARIKYDTPFRGSMTIEVEHEPPSDLERTDSDQFEPDTLDRKPKKQSFCDISAWDGHKPMETDFNQINSLPDLSRQQMMSPVPSPAAIKPRTASFILRSSNSFRNLREIYESPLVAQQESCKCEKKPTPEEEGRILTLEAKHSRRQRGMGVETSPTHSVVDITKVNKTTIKISSPKAEKATVAPPPPRPKASNQHYCPPLPSQGSKRPLPPPPPPSSAEQQHQQHQQHHSPEEDAYSLHSEVTEVTGVSEFDNNTMSSAISATTEERTHTKVSSRTAAAKTGGKVQEEDYEGMYSKKINSLRNDYSLTKYLNRRKSQREEASKGGQDAAPKDAPETVEFSANKNLKDVDLVQFDALSVSSRSNRSSGHLSERTKEMYRNAGVPVGIAYPQRAASSSGAPNSGGNVQTVYRCEIEQAQLTNGMQIAIGLKDRAKKAKDLKNAWRKFVTMAANKFSPSQSPAPTYGSKNAAGFLEDDGIASIIEDAAQSAGLGQPGSQTYYEQRFGQLDSGYMSTDSTELYKRNVYDRYNFKMLSGGRGQVIRVDTIEDNDEEESGPNDSRFEDLEHMVSPGHSRRSPDTLGVVNNGDLSDADSDKTLTRSHSQTNSQELNVRGSTTTMSSYSSDEQGGRGHSTCCGSSETDEETNAEDMWESGAESIETHSVLYKMIRKS
ncbi:serine-rich adhesin for platelets [Drosophila kikkawai]|uniref:Serine-rich adhesin for platelets n=1 Tax=Drosophila kikkawai TaxID=30033 RepID=A0ABM4GDP8_DROKI